MTSFEYRLHPVGPQVLGGPIFYSLEDAPAILRSYRDFIAGAPDELTTVFNLGGEHRRCRCSLPKCTVGSS